MEMPVGDHPRREINLVPRIQKFRVSNRIFSEKVSKRGFFELQESERRALVSRSVLLPPRFAVNEAQKLAGINACFQCCVLGIFFQRQKRRPGGLEQSRLLCLCPGAC